MFPDNEFSPTLGTFSYLPREIRDRIYNHVLDFSISRSEDLHPPSPFFHKPSSLPATQPASRTSLLLTSRTIHLESKISLFTTNEFGLWIDYDFDYACDPHFPSPAKGNMSIMGRPGYRYRFGLCEYGKDREDGIIEPIPWDILPYVQRIFLSAGAGAQEGSGIRESDIVPCKSQTRLGPERPGFRSLLSVVEEVCGVLRMCRKIHLLKVSLRSVEQTPGSIEMVLAPIRKLRAIGKTHPTVYSMQEDRWVDWNLKGSYGRYLNRVMALPEGTGAPRYVGDEREPGQSEDEIFDMIGGRWMGGKTFEYPEDEFDEDDQEDEEMEDDEEWDEEEEWNEEDELQEFLENELQEFYDGFLGSDEILDSDAISDLLAAMGGTA